jgi:homospermidine synthase
MVSWFVKQALLDVAAKVGLDHAEPASRADWAS